MKILYIIRHAKSSWVDLSMKDFDRPLNQRGNRDAPIMAQHCKSKGYVPDIIISSSAKRAKETSTIFKNTMKIDDNKYTLFEGLYLAPEDKYFEEAQLVDESYHSVMMFGHNPGITYLANSISDDYIDNVPTCGVLVIRSSVSKWSEIDPSNCKLVDFTYPKKL